MHAPRGRDEIKSTSRASSARGKNTTPVTQPGSTNILSTVWSFSTLSRICYFLLERETPYLRRSMNSAGRVTLFFLLIVLITQGRFNCIQDINRFYEHKNFENITRSVSFVPTDLNSSLVRSSGEKSIDHYSYAGSREKMNNHIVAYCPTKFV